MGSSAPTDRGLLAALGVALTLAGCAGGEAVPPPATPEVPVDAPGPTPDEAVDPPVRPLSPRLPLSLVSPLASAVGVIEVARLAPLDVPTFARWFVLDLSGVDLETVRPLCGFDPMKTVERLVFSGSADASHVVAALVSPRPTDEMLDCLGKLYPDSEAKPFGNQVALDLGRERLWAAEKDGTLWMGMRDDLAIVLGVEERSSIPDPILIDGAPPQEVFLDGTPIPAPVGRAEEAVAALSRDPRALLAASVVGATDGMFSLPALDVAFAGDGDEIALTGRVEAREERRLDESDLRKKARREFERAFEERLPKVVATPLLVAVDEARIEVTNEEVRFSGRTPAVGLLRMLVEAQARRNVERLLEK